MGHTGAMLAAVFTREPPEYRPQAGQEVGPT